MGMKRQIICSLLAAVLILPSAILGVPSRSGRAHSITGSTFVTAGRKPSSGDGRITAIIELKSEASVPHLAKAAGQVGHLDLKSDEAARYERSLHQEQSTFESAARRIVPDLEVAAHLTKLANIVSAEISERDLGRISTLPGVQAVEVAEQYTATLDKSVPLINAPAMWNALGGAQVAGQGIKIAIVDSGIDITNPLFDDAGFTAPSGFPIGQPGFTNNKVIAARVFLPDKTATPNDEDGHGTNVAGIAAGDFNTATPLGPISGVAPQAYLGNYRVLDQTGAGRNDLIAEGIEQAVTDGFDIVNLSLGGPPKAKLTMLDRVVDNAVSAGVAVITSAGDTGGEMKITSPGTAPAGITVTAFTNSHLVTPVVNVTGPAPVPSQISSIAAAMTVGGSQPLVGGFGPFPYADVAPIDGTGLACSVLPAGSLSGKIALIQRGICSFPQKVINAQTAGAVGAVIFNEPAAQAADGGDELLTIGVAGSDIPTVFIGHTNGTELQAWASANPQGPQLHLAPLGETPFQSKLVLTGSGDGPTALGVLKPDVAAPGVFIYSGAIKQPNTGRLAVSDPSGFLAVSGTSQAAPHCAGAVALLKQLHPSWTPAELKSAMISSSVNDLILSDGPNQTPAGILIGGAGRIDLQSALSITAGFDPVSLSLGVKKTKAVRKGLNATVNVTNLTESTATFGISTNAIEPGVSASTNTTTLTLNAGETQAVVLTLLAGSAAAEGDYTGYIVLTGPSGASQHIPYWVRLKGK